MNKFQDRFFKKINKTDQPPANLIKEKVSEITNIYIRTDKGDKTSHQN